ncbi:MAG: DUF190 domain-containing protein [Bacteroidia bacterium]|nr:DUF190 domain-containing protein [Bacteroidia bacterium]
METTKNAVALRIYLGSTDKHKQELLYESLVFKAKEQGLAGATVTKGILGFGASSVIHSYKFWEITEKLPVVVEIIDEKTKILAFFESIKPSLETIKYGCLATLEELDILLYKPGEKRVF